MRDNSVPADAREARSVGPNNKPLASPTVTIVTAVFNRAGTIANAIESVVEQTSNSIEYIIVDGMSNDGTSGVVSEYSDSISRVIREPDDGIYDALNKGIEAATGDIIGFVHADDMLECPNTIESIQDKFAEDDYDAVYGDLLYVSPDDSQRIVRYWQPGEYERSRFRFGWMPPHPALYVRKSAYQQFGNYRTDFGSGADYECVVRLLYKHQLKVGYLNQIVTRMRVGGESNVTLSNRVKANRSDRLAWLENGLRPPFGLRLTKPLSKLPQYMVRPKKC